jgi:hypothetical protein
MKNRFTLPALTLAAGLAAFGGSTLAAPEQHEGRCTLTYKASVNAAGPCTYFEEGPIASVHGTVEETGQTYIATIDNSKNEGLLIGAGTFTLADGKLEKNDMLDVRWPNGYVLTITPK